MDIQTLTPILAEHKLWLDSGYISGNRANLVDVFLEDIDLSGLDLTHINLRDSVLTNVNLSNSCLRNGNLKYTTLKNVNLSNANLTCAKLANSDLYQVNLTNANLWDANLHNAALYSSVLDNVELRWASMGQTHGDCFATGSFGKDYAIAAGGYIVVGCVRHPYSYWLEHYEEIGYGYRYTPEEIEIYGQWIKMAVKWLKNK